MIIKLEEFVKNASQYSYTQTYEAFAQCITEFLTYFKKILNSLGCILVEKSKLLYKQFYIICLIFLIKLGEKFTLVDFLIRINDPYFILLDLINKFCIQTKADENKLPHEKSLNLLYLIYKNLVDSYSSNKDVSIVSKFLMWLYAHVINPYLNLIDSFIQDGTNLDIKYELGFKRNKNISIDHSDYWVTGYEMISKLQSHIPNFLRIIIFSAFKISKHMEIIKILGDFNQPSFIYENFLKQIFMICPYLDHKESYNVINIKNDSLKNKTCTFLDLNMRQLNLTSNVNNKEKNNPRKRITPIETLIQNYLFEKKNLADENSMCLNLDKYIENIFIKLLNHHMQWCSNILMEKLFQKFHLIKYFEFIHSYFLFKSNEIMFLFSKKLFDSIKIYELYQEDAILNNLFYSSANSVFTTTTLIQNSPFNHNSVTFHYEKSANNTQSNNSSRLINRVSLKMNVKWPLNQIIRPNQLNEYNKIFLFILQIKQIKYDLDSLDLKGNKYHVLNECKKFNMI
jgi:hypothetical protein